MEATIKTSLKEDDLGKSFSLLKDELAEFKSEIAKGIRNFIWWMFFFAAANVCSTTFIFWWFLRK